MMPEEMISMEMHAQLHPQGSTTEIMRVPGGWIYTQWLDACNNDGSYGQQCTSVFVPEKESDR